MLSLERVNLSDVLPLVDEYGNEYLSRDYSLDVNQAYVQELADSMSMTGEPDTPIVVVRDGDVYRVKDGNSRVRAMNLLGTEECYAVVDDDTSIEQAVAETVVRTNVKKKYELLEESRFQQQLAMFGDDEYVSKVSGMAAERAGMMRRGRAAAGDRSGQMTIEQLVTVAELEGYPELQQKAIDSEGTKQSWEYTRYELMRSKRKLESKAAMRAKADELKIKLVEDRDDIDDNLVYISMVTKTDDLASMYMEASADYKGIVGFLDETYNGASIGLYGSPLDSREAEKAAEDATVKEATDRYNGVIKSIDESIDEWVHAKLDHEGMKQDTLLRRLPNLAVATSNAFFRQWYVKDAVSEFPELKRRRIGIVDFAVGYTQARKRNNGYGGALAKNVPLSEMCRSQLGKYLEWIGFHVADGWTADDDQAEVIELIKKKLAEAGEASEQ